MHRPKHDNVSNSGWLQTLAATVAEKPLVVLRFTDDEWDTLCNSRHGTTEFTIARSYPLVEALQVPTLCLLVGREFGGKSEIHLGLLKSRKSNTTLESRLKIAAARRISPSTEAKLLSLVTKKGLKTNLRKRLREKHPVIPLSPVLSHFLVNRLAGVPGNQPAMRAIAALLESPKTYSSNLSLQDDAVSLALKTFGLSAGASAATVEVPNDANSALKRISILEDAVIEHHAKEIPGFRLARSDLTGRAVFRKDNQILEVITANKRPLEEVFGVDLIYLNATKRNIVMVQYKMLEPFRKDNATDWIYRPDQQLEKETRRMSLFRKSHQPGKLEYRINSQVFYIRFVRRDAELGKTSATIPIDHLEVLQRDPRCKGPKGALRISYETLDGRYLRQDGFTDLVSSGYIGAYAKTTHALTSIIRAALKDGRAVVAAVQSLVQYKS